MKMFQKDLRVYKEYKVIGKGGKIFIVMRDSSNTLMKLESVDATGHNKKFVPIKSLEKAHDFVEPTKEDYNLFLKCGSVKVAVSRKA